MIEKPPDWSAEYVGLPFEPRGRDRNGLDCWGLARLVLREQAGLELPSYQDAYEGTDYKDGAGIEALIFRNLSRYVEPIAPGSEKLFDLMHLRMGDHLYHVGTVLGGGKMLHIERGCQSVVERYRNPAWQFRIAGFYRTRTAAGA